MSIVHVVQMTVMQVIDVSIVADGSMATSLFVMVVVTLVDFMIVRHSPSVRALAPVCKPN